MLDSLVRVSTIIFFSFLDSRLEDVAEQCLILSNGVEAEFPGQLWNCTSCRKDGMMMGNTREAAWAKQHKNCKLFMKSALSVKVWGRSNIDKANCNPYGYPKDLKASLVVKKKR